MIIASKVYNVMAREHGAIRGHPEHGESQEITAQKKVLDGHVVLRTPRHDALKKVLDGHVVLRTPRHDAFESHVTKQHYSSLLRLPRALHAFAMTVFLVVFISSANAAMYDDSDDIALTTDSRIKTYIYSPNEVYLLVLHYGFQSNIEFSKGETVDTITLGDSYLWKITPLGNKLFIKPMEKNIRTNMTIITNKRTYQFDIVAKELLEGDDKDLV